MPGGGLGGGTTLLLTANRAVLRGGAHSHFLGAKGGGAKSSGTPAVQPIAYAVKERGGAVGTNFVERKRGTPKNQRWQYLSKPNKKGEKSMV